MKSLRPLRTAQSPLDGVAEISNSVPSHAFLIADKVMRDIGGKLSFHE
jgi:hypothetical protein